MKNIILFASGSGTNVEAIVSYFEGKNLAHAVAIVCNNPEAGVIERAKRLNIPLIQIDRAKFKSEDFLQELQQLQPDLLVLAGFLWKVPEHIVKAFPDKIVNIHPALLPKYGGKGMYGHYVHEAVIANSEKESGITIHYVNEHYDEGNIIVQARCRVEKDDNGDSLAARIHHLEHFFFPRTIEYLLSK